MADSLLNNKNFAPPTAEDEEAAWTLLSFKDNNANTSQAFTNISNTISPENKTTEQSREVGTLKRAIAQGAPVPAPALTSCTPSRLVFSSGEQAIQKTETGPKLLASHLTSDVATTSGETRRAVRECFMVNSDRTILAGRIDSDLRQKRSEERR